MKIKLIALMAITLVACKMSNNSHLLKVTDFKEKSTVSGSNIIDVRSPEEFKEGYIKGATNVDYNGANFESEISTLDKNGTYYLYCLSGRRSGEALDKMISMGYKNTYSLEGGIKAWKAANLPVEVPPVDPNDTTSKTTTADPTDFKTAIYGDKLVLVDFNATWCGPCKRMQPFVDMIREERAKEVIVFSIDTDEETQLAMEYQIVNLPTVILMKKGTVLYREEGYHDQQSLNDLVTKFK